MRCHKNCEVAHKAPYHESSAPRSKVEKIMPPNSTNKLHDSHHQNYKGDRFLQAPHLSLLQIPLFRHFSTVSNCPQDLSTSSLICLRLLVPLLGECHPKHSSSKSPVLQQIDSPSYPPPSSSLEISKHSSPLEYFYQQQRRRNLLEDT